MIAVSLNVGGGVRLIKPAKLCMCTQKHYKHNEDGRTAPGVCGNGSVPLSHSGNVVTRIGIHTHVLVHYSGKFTMDEFLCAMCAEPWLDDIQDTIQCSNCQNWVHSNCSNLTKTNLKQWSANYLTFVCKCCAFDGDSYDSRAALDR